MPALGLDSVIVIAPSSAPSLSNGGVWVGVWGELTVGVDDAPSPGTNGVWDELDDDDEAPSPCIDGVWDGGCAVVDGGAPSPSIDGVWESLVVLSSSDSVLCPGCASVPSPSSLGSVHETIA